MCHHFLARSAIFLFCGLLVLPAVPVRAAGEAGSAGRELRLTFAGDIMAHTQNFRATPYEAIYAPIARLLRDGDLSFANLEFPIDDAAPLASFPCFNVHSDYPWAAITAGFNVFSLANNHSGDQGKAAIKKTQQAMQALADRSRRDLQRDIWFNGLKPDPADPPWRMETIQVDGRRIGFVALAEWVNEVRFTPWVQSFDCREDPKGTALLDWLASVRPSVDLLILSYHWGDEYSFLQSSGRAAFSRKLADAGVDIIWGNHPHVLQQWYLLDTVRGQTLVMPSLGNFVSAQSWGIGPDRKGSIDAAKGNSVLFKVGVEWAGGKGIRFSELNPVLIANWRNANGQMVVRTMADLMANESGEWLSFWKYRYTIMSDFIQNSVAATRQYGLPSD